MNQLEARPSPWARPALTTGVIVAVLMGGIVSLAAGLWAFFAPESFAAFVAFPYNRHLLHDIGAFEIGIGATMLFALLWADSILVVLAGYVVGTGFHLISHVIDREIGGHSSDVPIQALLLLVGLVGIYARVRGNRP
jgi:hypothetical protein